MREKLYHMGIRGKVSRSTIAYANENRDWRIYCDFAQILIDQARQLYANDDFGLQLDETVYALDATIIDLCLSVFPWARYSKRTGAIKLHTLLDLRGNIPSFIAITQGRVHEVNILDELIPEAGAIYILDRGYLDFQRLYTLHQCCSFFVVRARANTSLKRLYSMPVDKSCGLRCDQIVVPTGFYLRKNYPEKLRRVVFVHSIKSADQSNDAAGINHCATVSIPMASRIIFQMDQATSTHKGILWYIRKCGEDSNLDRDICLCVDRHNKKTDKNRLEPLHNFTDFQHYSF
jgi:hypothetical protein